MIGLNKKLCVFGTMATSALLILAILVASVKSDVGVGVVSLSSSFGTTTGGGPRMMRGKNMVDDATAASAMKNRELIIGGTVLDKSVWDKSRRYLAALNYFRDDGSLEHSCTATLILRRVVLSAAHCFTDDESQNINATFSATDAITLNFYSYDDLGDNVTIRLCGNESGGGCSADLAYAVRHPRYDNFTTMNDFALIILPNTTAVTEGAVAEIDPVKLNSDINVPADGEELEVFGWGRLKFDKTDPRTLPRVPNTVILQYRPNDQCQKLYDRKEIVITEDMLCAFGDEAVGDGDSGGPIITLGALREIVQVGVTSWASEGLPDVFARVSDGFEWIKDTICQDIPGDEVFCNTATPTTAPTTTIRPTSSPTNNSTSGAGAGGSGSKSAKQPAAAKSSKAVMKSKSKVRN